MVVNHKCSRALTVPARLNFAQENQWTAGPAWIQYKRNRLEENNNEHKKSDPKAAFDREAGGYFLPRFGFAAGSAGASSFSAAGYNLTATIVMLLCSMPSLSVHLSGLK